MPKMKTHTGAKKRFKVTKSGRIKMSHAGRRHILNKKSTKRKRALRKAGYVDASNAPQVMRLIPYAK